MAFKGFQICYLFSSSTQADEIRKKKSKTKTTALYKIYFGINTAERRVSAFGGRLRLFFPETEVVPQVARQQLIRSRDTCCCSFFWLLILAWVRFWRVVGLWCVNFRTCTLNTMAAAGPRSSSDGGPASRGGFTAGGSKDGDGPSGSSNGGANGESERERDRATFECNICLDPARDAVISMCGHLFW